MTTPVTRFVSIRLRLHNIFRPRTVKIDSVRLVVGIVKVYGWLADTTNHICLAGIRAKAKKSPENSSGIFVVIINWLSRRVCVCKTDDEKRLRSRLRNFGAVSRRRDSVARESYTRWKSTQPTAAPMTFHVRFFDSAAKMIDNVSNPKQAKGRKRYVWPKRRFKL